MRDAWPKHKILLLSSILTALGKRSTVVTKISSTGIDLRLVDEGLRGLMTSPQFEDAYTAAYAKLQELYINKTDTVYRLNYAADSIGLHVRAGMPHVANLRNYLSIDAYELTQHLISFAVKSSLQDHNRACVSHNRYREIPAWAETFIAKETPWLLIDAEPYLNIARLKEKHLGALNQLRTLQSLYENDYEIMSYWFEQKLQSVRKKEHALPVALPDLSV